MCHFSASNAQLFKYEILYYRLSICTLPIIFLKWSLIWVHKKRYCPCVMLMFMVIISSLALKHCRKWTKFSIWLNCCDNLIILNGYLWQGILTNETRCLRCETVTARDETFLDLSLDIEQNSSITSCLKNFSSTETLNAEDKFFCDKCCRSVAFSGFLYALLCLNLLVLACYAESLAL